MKTPWTDELEDYAQRYPGEITPELKERHIDNQLQARAYRRGVQWVLESEEISQIVKASQSVLYNKGFPHNVGLFDLQEALAALERLRKEAGGE